MDRFILYPLFLAALAASAFLGWQLFEYAAVLPTWEAALADYRSTLQTANNEIGKANETIAEQDQRIRTARDQLNVTRGERDAALLSLDVERQNLMAEKRTTERQGATIAGLESDLRSKDSRIAQLSGQISQQIERISQQTSQINRLNNQVSRQETQISQQTSQISQQRSQISQKDATIAGLESDLRSKDSRIAQLSGQISQQSEQISRQETQISQQTSQINRLNTQVSQQTSQISRLNTQVSQQTSQITQLNTQIIQKDATIANLRTSLSEARTQRVLVPACSTNYYTSISGQLYCVSRRTADAPASPGESRAIDLPQTGRITLKIYRSGEPGSDQSMEILEHTVRNIEEYMGQPIPLQDREIRLDFVKEIRGGFAGVHKGTHMEILQEYESGQAWQRDYLGTIIAHEVAHYYWSGERNWLHEGAAEFLALYSENRRIGTPIRAQNRRCYQVANISQLEGQRYESTDDGFRCNYSLGEGLFVDLYNAVSADRFRQSFRELYDSGKNQLAGVHQVRQAYYYSNAWPIIDQWYGYREKPEAHWNNGEFLGFYIWQEGGEWVITSDENGRPCATTLRRNDQTTRGGFYVQTRDECHYTGVWSPEGDLLVVIHGTTYRAVDVQVRQSPRYGKDGAVRPGKGSPSLTVIGLRGELWND